MLGGFQVEVSHGLVGSKQAVLHRGTIYVSPAMYDLLRHASTDELENLLRNLPLAIIDPPPDPRAVLLSPDLRKTLEWLEDVMISRLFNPD